MYVRTCVCVFRWQFFYSNVQTENISVTYNPMSIANISEMYPLPDGVSVMGE